MKRKYGLVFVLVASFVLSAFAPIQAREAISSDFTGSAMFEPVQARIAYHAHTGQVRFIGANLNNPIPRASGLPASAEPEQAARAFLEAYGKLFGLTNQAQELAVMRTSLADRGRSFVRFQQVYQGIPVLGGELIVQMDQDKNVLSASGEVLPAPKVNVVPGISADIARQQSLDEIAKQYDLSVSALTATQPELWLYDPVLLDAPGPRLTSLVWRLEVQATDLLPIRELVLVDAHNGIIALHFNQIDTAKDRKIYDNNNNRAAGLPGAVLERVEGGAASGITDVDNAYDYAGDTYDFYSSYHGRDSLDNAGLQLVSTTRYCPSSLLDSCPYNNAFWNGQQMVYGEGYASADDVVGHEMTHGVTQYESNLFYYMQSGAINEAFSDIWGEFIDLTNSGGTDTPAARWLMGEDLPGGAIRDMSNPPAYGDPDKMTSTHYTCDFSQLDNGGVHTNSGVANKAAYLMADGGTFNGYTVSPLGITKTAKIWYELQTNLFTSASDYEGLYDGLQQACSDLVGTAGITAADCQEVKDAVDATEMNQQPVSCPAADAPVCPAGQTPSNLFLDDFEAGVVNWQSGANQGSDEWYYSGDANPYNFDPLYATSGLYNLWGYAQGATADYYVRMTSDVALPSGTVPYLRFDHAYAFEYSRALGKYYDGGVVEYSTNGGSNWQDAALLFTDNGYVGKIATSYGNPLADRDAFGGESHGYTSSRLNLSSLVGQSVRFRFRIGTDSSRDDYGWFIDDVRIYTCGVGAQPDVSINAHIVGNNLAPGDAFTLTLAIANNGGAAATNPTVTYEVPAEVLTPTFASTLAITPTGATSYTWQVQPLAVGANGLITIYGQIDPALPADFHFVNTATISDPEDNTPGNNSSVVTTGPDVGISKHVLGQDLAPGDWITFTLILSNTGNQSALSVMVTDIIPAEVLTPAFTSTLAITQVTGTGVLAYVWDVEPLSIGESGIITLHGRIDPSLASDFSFINTATISDTQDGLPDNNSSSVVVAGVSQTFVYLPIIFKDYPPLPHTPVLSTIENADGDGNYMVSWDLAHLADTYTLQEDDNATFSSPTIRYSGSATSWSASDQSPGTYYYRVQASNGFGNSDWSTVQSVTVNAPDRVPNDPSYSNQWGLPKVNAPAAWSLSTGTGVIIAIVDTGVDLDHPDLAGKIEAGRDFVNNDNLAQDDNGHGSHVAGIAAAMTDNSVGVAGLGWDAHIMPIKVLDSEGSGYDSDVADGIQWAAGHGAKVINMSLGGEGFSSVLQVATDYAYSQGALVVASAGNCGDPTTYYYNGCVNYNPVIYPAANTNVLAVGATTSSDTRASYSSFGSFVDVSAPGSSIYSTWWNNTYKYDSGTSMASPLVAGLASLVWARNSALTNAQVANILMNTGVDLGTSGRDDYYGYGRVDAAAAVNTASTMSVADGVEELAPQSPITNLSSSIRPGMVLVRFKRGTLAADRQAVLARLNLSVSGQIEGLAVFKIDVPEGQERDIAAQLAADPAVEFAQPDYVRRIQ